MSVPTLHNSAEDYLATRRSFGFRLSGYDGPLADFVTYLQRMGLDTVTVESALAWAVEAHTTPLRQRSASASPEDSPPTCTRSTLAARCLLGVCCRWDADVSRRTSTARTRSTSSSARAASCVLRSAPRRSTPCSACSS